MGEVCAITILKLRPEVALHTLSNARTASPHTRICVVPVADDQTDAASILHEESLMTCRFACAFLRDFENPCTARADRPLRKTLQILPDGTARSTPPILWLPRDNYTVGIQQSSRWPSPTRAISDLHAATLFENKAISHEAVWLFGTLANAQKVASCHSTLLCSEQCVALCSYFASLLFHIRTVEEPRRAAACISMDYSPVSCFQYCYRQYHDLTVTPDFRSIRPGFCHDIYRPLRSALDARQSTSVVLLWQAMSTTGRRLVTRATLLTSANHAAYAAPRLS